MTRVATFFAACSDIVLVATWDCHETAERSPELSRSRLGQVRYEDNALSERSLPPGPHNYSTRQGKARHAPGFCGTKAPRMQFPGESYLGAHVVGTISADFGSYPKDTKFPPPELAVFESGSNMAAPMRG